MTVCKPCEFWKLKVYYVSDVFIMTFLFWKLLIIVYPTCKHRLFIHHFLVKMSNLLLKLASLSPTTYSTSYNIKWNIYSAEFAPNFQKYPMFKQIYVASLGNLTLHCRPEGAPLPVITWLKDGVELPEFTDRIQQVKLWLLLFYCVLYCVF